ncbi:MAG: polysaccharide biosynthesis protein [Bacteroidales bacterium]|nr:polysaccharide biosynthesis protein [Bacteroidales bacterium]
MIYKNRTTPRSIILGIDIVIVFISILLAYLLRFNFNIPKTEIDLMPWAILAILSIRFLSFLLSKIFAGIIRYTEIQDVMRVLVVSLSGTIIITIFTLINHYLTDIYLIPRSVIIIELITTSLGLIFFRLIVKVSYTEFKSHDEAKKNIIIFGAGDAAVIAKAAITRQTDANNKVVAFFDDNPKKTGKKIEGITILAGSDLENYISKNDVHTIIIAVQNISPKRKTEIANLCLNAGLTVKDIPPVNDWINGELSAKQIKDIDITDLLERDEITINHQEIKKAFQSKTVLVTGAAGSIGSEIVRQLLSFGPNHLILVDQAETPLHHLELELSTQKNTIITFLIADIREFDTVNQIIRSYKPQIIFHAAAYKHVPMMENNPAEAIKTNVMGTKNLADLSVENGLETFVMISSDKAVNPTNVMGASKRIAEIYIQSLCSENIKTRFITTRFGNVLGSNGSVIPLFKKQIQDRKPITITHPEITRYFMTIPEASKLVLEAAAGGNKNEIFVFDMGKSVKIYDLAKKMIKLYGLELGKDIQIMFTGLRPGEKLYEELLATSENTIPTENKKILKAKVREINGEEAQIQIEKLINQSLKNFDNKHIVRLMKEIVPEFKSQNSEYESLD